MFWIYGKRGFPAGLSALQRIHWPFSSMPLLDITINIKKINVYTTKLLRQYMGFKMVGTKHDTSRFFKVLREDNTTKDEISSYLRTERKHRVLNAMLFATAIAVANPAANAGVNAIKQNDNSASIYKIMSGEGYGISLSYLNRYAYGRFDYKQVGVAQSNISGNIVDYGLRIGYPLRVNREVLIVPYIAFNEQNSSWTVVVPAQTQNLNNQNPTTTPPTTTPPTTTPPTTTPPTTTPPTTTPPIIKGHGHNEHGKWKECKDPDYKNHGNEIDGKDSDDRNHGNDKQTYEKHHGQNQKEGNNKWDRDSKNNGQRSHTEGNHKQTDPAGHNEQNKLERNDNNNNIETRSDNIVNTYVNRSFNSVDAVVGSITNPFTQFSSTYKESLGSTGVILQYSPDSRIVVSNEVEIGEIFNSATNTPFGTYRMPNSLFEAYGIKLNYLVPVSRNNSLDFFVAGQIMHTDSLQITINCQVCSDGTATYSSSAPINSMYEVGVGYSFR